MKLTPIKDKLENSITDKIYYDVFNKTWDSTSREILLKIDNEIYNPNWESIQEMQRRTLRNLQKYSK